MPSTPRDGRCRTVRNKNQRPAFVGARDRNHRFLFAGRQSIVDQANIDQTSGEQNTAGCRIVRGKSTDTDDIAAPCCQSSCSAGTAEIATIRSETRSPLIIALPSAFHRFISVDGCA